MSLNSRVASPVVISGVPGTGKSWFGRWLQDEYGFVYLEADAGGMSEYRLNGLDGEAFVHQLRSLAPRVVLEWGYPVEFLPRLQAIQRGGVPTWWFDGDRAAARASYIRPRGDAEVTVAAFEKQLAAIERTWPALKEFYEGRIVHTLRADGSFVNPERVMARLFPDGL